MLAVVMELELIFHVRPSAVNSQNERVMERYKTIVYKEIRGNKICYANVSSLLHFVRALANVMPMVRQYPNLSCFDNFDRVVKTFLSAGLAVSSSCEALHIICDSYIDE